MPTEAGCHECGWREEFDEHAEPKQAQRSHVHSEDTWRKDVWGENQ